MPHFALKTHGRKGGITAGQHAAYILRDVETPETQGYVQYVLRESRNSEDREDLYWVSRGNMPTWVKGNPVQFFLAAERYEGVNRRVSASLEIALPRELSREAQIAVIQDFCAIQFPQSPYLVGLHDSVGASGEPNPHVHVTWSERIHDGRERTPENFFRRPPYGAGKDPIYHAKGWLGAARQSWSDVVNVALEREGITGACIDLRSLEDRGIDRHPEPRLSPVESTLAKRDGIVTDSWQYILDGRKARGAVRGQEQGLAAAAWEARKGVLGLTDIPLMERETVVQILAEHMRTQSMARPPKVTLEALCTEQVALEAQLQAVTQQVQRTHGHIMVLEGREHASHRARPVSRAQTPARTRQVVHGMAMEEEDHGGLQAPDFDRKRGRDGYSW